MRLFSLRYCGFFSVFGMLSAHVAADEPEPGVNFTYKDWQLVCDNTNTCRAVGATNNALALMITRHAGPDQSPTASLRFADFDRLSMSAGFVEGVKNVTLFVNNKVVGFLKSDARGSYLLDELQIAAVVEELKGKGRVLFEVEDYSVIKKTATLSGQGAYAVFLKMDEFQQRVGTQAALVKKGTANENFVLSPLKPPVVRRAAVSGGWRLATNDGSWSEIRGKLLSGLKQTDDCPYLSSRSGSRVRVEPLSEKNLLFSVVCKGYPGFGDAAPSRDYRVGYWVVDKGFRDWPLPVTFDATRYGRGRISSEKLSKNRECSEYKSWVWDGRKFVPGDSYIDGVCEKNISRSFNFTGGWRLPIFVVNEIGPDDL